MTAETQTTDWNRQCLEALKSLGKTLGQMSLYKIGHPTVAATLKIAEEHLGESLAQAPELAFSLDGDKVLANGRIIGNAGSLPNALTAVFARFKLSSLTVKAGVTNAELAAFCELAAMRSTPGAKPPDAKPYFDERGVTHIVFNEAIYAKVDGEAPLPSQKPGVSAAPAADLAAAIEPIERAIEAGSIETTVQTLVDKAVPDPGRRGEVYSRVMDLVRQDIERRLEEVVKPLRKEKTVLQNEQQRTQSVLQNAVEGVVVVDEHGKILMMNPAAEQVYGTTLAQAAGMPLAEKAGEERMITLAAEIVTPNDRAVSKDVKVAGVDDVKRTLKSAGAVVQNEEGKVVGMVSSLSDVAKHKEMQRMQRDFIAHVTHELRAPLSSIRAALEILQGEVASKIKEDENRMLQTAMKNSDRLADLINSILDFSKIESGQMNVFPKKADAEKIARDGVDSLAAWASKKRINLQLICAPQLPPVSADAQRTVQVLINLLSNAIKFTPVGGQITVRVANEKGGQTFGAGDHFVLYSVIDTGCGIAKADQKKIFEKFVQIASGEMHYGGTGLGLAIAKALVHLQGGKMWVESAEGKGSTFLFTLPIWTVREGEGTTRPPGSKPAWWKRLLGLK